MTTFQMAPGAMVLKGPTHAGLDRMTTGAAILARMLVGAIHHLDVWREARIAAHNDAMLVQIAAHDSRVMADLRAAFDRQGPSSGA
jgi:hypothetical protein